MVMAQLSGRRDAPLLRFVPSEPRSLSQTGSLLRIDAMSDRHDSDPFAPSDQQNEQQSRRSEDQASLPALDTSDDIFFPQDSVITHPEGSSTYKKKKSTSSQIKAAPKCQHVFVNGGTHCKNATAPGSPFYLFHQPDKLDWTQPYAQELILKAARNGTLEEASLRGAQLSGVDLSGCNLKGVDLRDADLSGANLKRCGLPQRPVCQCQSRCT